MKPFRVLAVKIRLNSLQDDSIFFQIATVCYTIGVVMTVVNSS